MSTNEINQSEWHNPQNWHGLKWISVYYSKQDTRLWIPKQIPWMGKTLNWAHPKAAVSFSSIFLGILIISFLILFFNKKS